MQWTYLFIHKRPSVQASRQIISLFTFVFDPAAPSDVTSLGVAESTTHVNKLLIFRGAWKFGLLWINKYFHCIYRILFHKGAWLQTSHKSRGPAVSKSHPTFTWLLWHLGQCFLPIDINFNVKSKGYDAPYFDPF